MATINLNYPAGKTPTLKVYASAGTLLKTVSFTDNADGTYTATWPAEASAEGTYDAEARDGSLLIGEGSFVVKGTSVSAAVTRGGGMSGFGLGL